MVKRICFLDASGRRCAYRFWGKNSASDFTSSSLGESLMGLSVGEIAEFEVGLHLREAKVLNIS